MKCAKTALTGKIYRGQVMTILKRFILEQALEKQIEPLLFGKPLKTGSKEMYRLNDLLTLYDAIRLPDHFYFGVSYE